MTRTAAAIATANSERLGIACIVFLPFELGEIDGLERALRAEQTREIDAVEGRRLDRSPVDVTVVMKLMLSRDLARARLALDSIRCASAEACGLRAGAGELFRSLRTSYTVSFAKGPIEKVGEAGAN